MDGCALDAASGGPVVCLAERQKRSSPGETEYTWDTHPSVLVLNLRATSAAVRVVLNPPCHWMNNWFPADGGNSPSRLTSNKRQSKYMHKESPSSRETQTQNHTPIFFNASFRCLPDESGFNYLSGCKNYSRTILFGLYIHIMNYSVHLGAILSHIGSETDIVLPAGD